MIPSELTFGADDVRVGHTYVIALAEGVFVRATVTFERVAFEQRFVRFISPALKKPGYCSAEKFAEIIRGSG